MKRSSIPDSYLTDINCPVCDAGKRKFLYEDREFPVWKCVTCSHIYVSPQPSNAFYSEYYGESFHDETENADLAEYHRHDVYNQTVQAINQYMQYRGDLLDVGAGFGGFLEYALKEGWRIHGIEFNRSRYNKCKQRFSSEQNSIFQCSTFETAELNHTSFDAIVLINVIEHVKNPVDICERAFELLRPGGCLVIRWPQFAYRGSLSAAPEHLHGFTGKSIATLFNKLGFINVRDYWAGIGDFKQENNLIKIILAIIFEFCGRATIAFSCGRLQIPFVSRLTLGRKP